MVGPVGAARKQQEVVSVRKERLEILSYENL